MVKYGALAIKKRIYFIQYATVHLPGVATVFLGKNILRRHEVLDSFIKAI